MNPELHKLLLEIEHKFNIEIEDYFELIVEDRNRLAKIVVEYYREQIINNPTLLIQLDKAFTLLLKENESQGEYEKCDLLNRIVSEIKRFDFFEK